jgi:hypothetical protein
MLAGPDTGAEGHYRKGMLRPIDATADQVVVGERTLAVARELIGEMSDRPLLFARVDIVTDDAGPQVLEVELTQPSLYAGLAPGRVTHAAAAIAARVD